MADQEITLPLIRGRTTLLSALEQEENMLLELGFPDQRIDFFFLLYHNRSDVETLASYHLGLSPQETCTIGGVNEWIHGSFNVCIPLYVGKRGQNPEKRALIRFSLPYKLGESHNPGNVNEKLRCEAATYIWIQENCPEISIPALWGFGFVGGQSFTKPQNITLGARFLWAVKRSFMWLFGYTLPCPYICHQRSTMLDTGYLVLECVGNSETGVQMLSETWDEDRDQPEKRTNLFRGISRIMLSLSRVPLPRIGSWTLDENGVLRLSNRPLTLRLHQLENGGVPTNIGRSLTYSAAEPYYHDLLSYHDSRIRHQPNSMENTLDGRAQMKALTLMRALLPHFSDRDLREGPFLYRLTDLHPSNLFVDSQWNVKHVIDLEWACSLPAETLRPPYWLTGHSIDGLTGENLEPFSSAYKEFTTIFEEEEKLFPAVNNVSSYRTSLLRSGWETGKFWYFHALDSPKGLYNLFHSHIYPRFASPSDASAEFPRLVSAFWASDAEKVIAAKLRDKEEYEKSLRHLFEAANEEDPEESLEH